MSIAQMLLRGEIFKPTIVKGKIVAGDPAELNVLNPPDLTPEGLPEDNWSNFCNSARMYSKIWFKYVCSRM